MKLPQIIDSERAWKAAIEKLSIEEKILVKKKCEFILNEILAQNRSISLDHQRDMEFKTDRLRKRYDLRDQDPEMINNFFVKAHVIKLKQATEEGRERLAK